ncbi:hypothetical protein N7468_005332 [Penicillium chermesinum]|uniref:Uncharacterized protein n=1 Tax=Penicillium chermesinum TaxID=63820 RepID=A0A9W9NZA3_9EURO|nr:uncharacterized protein N7468_005332 [Penicillium chermesinum]KAJ5232376.1 hypothetical protein N7468_005332 [Penicillium chermesinum]
MWSIEEILEGLPLSYTALACRQDRSTGASGWIRLSGQLRQDRGHSSRSRLGGIADPALELQPVRSPTRGSILTFMAPRIGLLPSPHIPVPHSVLPRFNPLVYK